MAKAYRAKQDVSFPRPIAQVSETEWATEGANYPAGTLIPEERLTPKVRAKAEAGELDHVLIPLNDEEAEDAVQYEQSGEPQTGVFIAEHEAEAHALRMGGHVVIPRDQALESQAAGAAHAAEYQKAAKEAGIDRRPAQEAMARAESDEGRVPDHLLHGMETRTGLPHNRGLTQRQREEGPEFSEEDYSESDSSDDDLSQLATRPRPGQAAPSSEGDDSGETETGSSDSDQSTPGQAGQE